MRTLMMVVCLALVLSIAAPAQEMQTMTMSPQMMDACLMSAYNLSRTQLDYLRDQGFSNTDIAMAASISAKANQPLSDVVAAYNNTRDWNRVAAQFNVSMADIATMPVMDMDEEAFNRSFVSQYYGIPDSQVAQLRAEGYSWGTIYAMANASVRTNQPIQQIVALREQGLTWCQIADRYNIACADITDPVQMRAVTATRPIVGAGPMVRMPTAAIYDEAGNVVLTESMAERYYNQGYDWLDVAIAANISRETDVPIDRILLNLMSGMGWERIARNYGVAPDVALNVADYPFARRSVYSERRQMRRMEAIEQYQKPSMLMRVPGTEMEMMEEPITAPALPPGAGPRPSPTY